MEVGLGDRPRVAVVQGGARLHYALPVALQREGLLARVFAEWFVRPGTVRAALSRGVRVVAPTLGQRMADRTHPELDPRLVEQSLSLMLAGRLSAKRFPTVWAHKRWVLDRSARWAINRGFGGANAVIGFIRDTDPLLFETCRRLGMLTVGDQIIAPAAVEQAEAAKQAERWPDWEPPVAAGDEVGPNFDGELERRSWTHLRHVTCPSDYVREGLAAQGVGFDRTTVLPYPIDASKYPFVENRRKDGPVTVGFVGAVSLRKGAPYFFEVARRLASPNLRFVMVGPVRLRPGIAEKHKGAVEVVGPVPRSEVASRLASFDLMLLPTTCEGSPTSLMEAMATGLPVVTSPNSGTVARHGTEGLIGAYDRVEELAGHVERLAADNNLRREMGLAARRRVETFNLDWYGRELGGLFRRLLSRGKVAGS